MKIIHTNCCYSLYRRWYIMTNYKIICKLYIYMYVYIYVYIYPHFHVLLQRSTCFAWFAHGLPSHWEGTAFPPDKFTGLHVALLPRDLWPSIGLRIHPFYHGPFTCCCEIYGWKLQISCRCSYQSLRINKSLVIIFPLLDWFFRKLRKVPLATPPRHPEHPIWVNYIVIH